MAVTRQTYRVYYEDGTEQEVVSDQRDVVAFERRAGVGFNKALEIMTISAVREVAYWALKRTGKLPSPAATPRQWDNGVVEVEPVDDGEPVDPTQEEASPTGPSE